MTREKINKIISDIKREVDVEGLIDSSFEFNDIILKSRQQTTTIMCSIYDWKNIIKSRILKPVFVVLHKISPELAISIRNGIYRISHQVKMIFKKSNKYTLQNNRIYCLVDCTQTARTELCTGIQRVTKNIIQNLEKRFVPGVVCGEKYITSSIFYNQDNDISKNIDECMIDFTNVSKLVLLDSSWEYSDLFLKYIKQMKSKNNSEVFAFVHDLIPIYYPELVVSEYLISVFKKWHHMIFENCDHIICNSQATADNVYNYILKNNLRVKGKLDISYVLLGADLPKVTIIRDKFIRNKIKNFVSGKTFLMVGAIEPRKGHLVALEAFTKRLDAGDDIKLLIIGRNGWKNEDFINLLNNNKYYGKNILWLDDANDIELAWCYQNACCLIAASKDEGYGLPLVEAAHYGVPIICSDIPVFREVAQGYAVYFKVWDSDALADTIKKWLNSDEHPDSKNIKIYSWAEATKIFMEIVNGEREPYKIIK